MLFRSAATKDSEQSYQLGITKDFDLSALVSQPVIPPIQISLPPRVKVESELSARVGSSQIKSVL